MFRQSVSIVNESAFGIIRFGGAEPDAVFRRLTPVGICGMFVPFGGSAGITVGICHNHMAFACCFGSDLKWHICQTVLAAVSNLDKFQIPADDLIGDGIVFCSQFHDFSLFCDVKFYRDLSAVQITGRCSCFIHTVMSEWESIFCSCSRTGFIGSKCKDNLIFRVGCSVY